MTGLWVHRAELPHGFRDFEPIIGSQCLSRAGSTRVAIAIQMPASTLWRRRGPAEYPAVNVTANSMAGVQTGDNRSIIQLRLCGFVWNNMTNMRDILMCSLDWWIVVFYELCTAVRFRYFKGSAWHILCVVPNIWDPVSNSLTYWFKYSYVSVRDGGGNRSFHCCVRLRICLSPG